MQSHREFGIYKKVRDEEYAFPGVLHFLARDA
jgi:hypothetical protein